jgi:hypothetical protein
MKSPSGRYVWQPDVTGSPNHNIGLGECSAGQASRPAILDWLHSPDPVAQIIMRCTANRVHCAEQGKTLILLAS